MSHLILLPRRAFGLVCCFFLAFVPSGATAAGINVTVADANSAAIDDAVVYALPLTSTAGAKPARGSNVEQFNKEFIPHVTPVQTGTLVSFPNRDDIRHHVYSFSPAKAFELKLYAGTAAPPVLFDKPGQVVLGCNIHDHMLAYIYVVDTPHFAKSVAGSTRIDNLPAGDFEVRIWHPRSRSAISPQRVKLGADGTIALKFALDLQPQGKPPRQ